MTTLPTLRRTQVSPFAVELAPFVCDYFFNRYGVKRLVQVKLQELMVTIRSHLDEDPRVRRPTLQPLLLTSSFAGGHLRACLRAVGQTKEE